VAIDEFCKQLVRSNPGALAQWLLGVSGVGGLVCDELVGASGVGAGAGNSLGASGGSIAPAFYWQLIDTELAAETHRAETHWAVSHRADTVILQAATAAEPGAAAESGNAGGSDRKPSAAKGNCRWLPPVGRARLFSRTNQCVFQDGNSRRFGHLSSRRS